MRAGFRRENEAAVVQATFEEPGFGSLVYQSVVFL